MKESFKKQYPREYRIWKALRARCNSTCFSNTYYQLHNIQVDIRWNSFKNFIEDMGICPEGCSIDRIDGNGNYTKDNCRWADKYTQANNKINHNVFITYKNKTQTLKTWAKELGIKYNTLYGRITRSGLTFEQAIQKDPFNKLYHYKGQSYTLTELSEMSGIPILNIVDRKHKGWDIEKIINQKVRQNQS
ncbi:hypothetical protein EKK58_07770 [Candidatus Dependentiae bacterium]|nr:MAG: hypothetical protein EKK58_07770 [Candidatus Dependentiae bacterium]